MTNQDIKNYIEGNANHLLDKIGILPEEVKNQVTQRQIICNECEFLDRVNSKCSICKCAYPGFTFSLGKHCPKDKWQEIKK
ncbi:MAG: hypothetical protein AABY22_21120 [Nanoarchaeota archaeon]